MKVRAYVSFDECNKVHYYRDFELVKQLPEIGDIVYGSDYDGEKKVVVGIREVHIDTCQGNDDVYEYNYYEVRIELRMLNDDNEWYVEEESCEFMAIKR